MIYPPLHPMACCAVGWDGITVSSKSRMGEGQGDSDEETGDGRVPSFLVHKEKL